jgi:hypothetical protein
MLVPVMFLAGIAFIGSRQPILQVHSSVAERAGARAAISRILAERNEPNCRWIGDDQESTPESYFRPQFIDLNNDRRREIILRATDSCECSATGNCSFWIVETQGATPRKLLVARDVQRWYVLRSRTNGFRDVVTATHNSAAESELTVYKYDGTSYQRAEQWLRTYRYLGGTGKGTRWSRPRFERIQ